MEPSVPSPPPIDYFIRFVQVHETFRRPEIEALATLANINVEFLHYSESSPYSTIRISPLPTTPSPPPTTTTALARTLITRSISSKAIYELWGSGIDYPSLHASLKRRSSHLWPLYATASFKFDWDTFAGSRPLATQRAVIDSFAYMGFGGEIRMRDPKERFTIFEEYEFDKDRRTEGKEEASAEPMGLKHVYLGRFVGSSARARGVLDKYTLKKRGYINTTSMDAELAFLMANVSLASEGKVFYDPFVGTGSLLVSCAHFGARCWGSDIDGRMVRGSDIDGRMVRGSGGGGGKGKRDVRSNFGQYGIEGGWMDGFVADLTHCPFRRGKGGWLDGIVCDPPYGVREGLKVLGHREGRDRANGEVVWIEGVAAHLQDAYVPPKKPYSLEAMLGDILDFAARMLVNEGRVSLWMPTANDAEEELAVPAHRALELMSVCVQEFNKWSRRLLTYRRIPGVEVENDNHEGTAKSMEGSTADELNGFRKRYFQGFRNSQKAVADGDSALLADRGKGQVSLHRQGK